MVAVWIQLQRPYFVQVRSLLVSWHSVLVLVCFLHPQDLGALSSTPLRWDKGTKLWLILARTPGLTTNLFRF